MPEGDHLAVSQPSCPLVASLLEEKHLERVQKNIAAHAGVEKTIQSKLVWHNRNTLLDAEIAFNEDGEQICHRCSFARKRQVLLQKLHLNASLRQFDDQLPQIIEVATKTIHRMTEYDLVYASRSARVSGWASVG